MNKEDSSLDNATKERFQKSQLRIESGIHPKKNMQPRLLYLRLE